MANAPFLLEPNFNFNPSLQQTFRLPPLRSLPTTLSSGDNKAFKLNYPPYKVIRGYPKLRIKSFFMCHKPKGKTVINGVDNGLKAVAISNGINEVLSRSIKNVLNVLQKPVITGALLGLLLLYDHHRGCVALAASIGVGTAVGVRPAVGVELGFCATMMMLGSILTIAAYSLRFSATKKISVLKLQVGLLGTGKSLQKDLNRIAQVPDTYCRECLSYVLQETTLSLLRHPEYCISGYSSVYMKRSIEEVENRFNQLCTEERGKFDVETLVNVNNIGKQRVTTQRSRDFRNEYIVITIIVGVEGGHKLPPINSSANLKEALRILLTIPSSRVEAVAVLLTPQNENDTLTERKFLEDYSLLHPLRSP